MVRNGYPQFSQKESIDVTAREGSVRSSFLLLLLLLLLPS
jgi:hypothetical protein